MDNVVPGNFPGSKPKPPGPSPSQLELAFRAFVESLDDEKTFSQTLTDLSQMPLKRILQALLQDWTQ